MSKITALRTGGGRGRRVKMFLDGKAAFSLAAEVAARQRLHVGQELSAANIDALARADSAERCLSAALRYLSYRPRSESEIRERLRSRFDEESIAAAIARLREQGLVDDAAFARFWKESREAFSPRSRWVVGQELRRKGVDTGVIDDALADADDLASAYRAASARARRLPISDYADFRRRLGEHLRRRGFAYGVIGQTVKRLWEELSTASQRAPAEKEEKER